ncbi:MAG: PAS domain-containing protein [Candidatus Nomurabacteria bacterium]|nr:MAG: PAS domain-containing protein [Candidatus Nomurabacteria bacterium]
MLFYENVDELTLLNDAIGASDMAWWVMEFPSGVVFFHPNKVKMLGFSEQDADRFAHYSSFTDRIHKDDYDKTMQAMRNHLQGKSGRYEASYRIKAKDGTYRRFFDRGKIVARDKEGNVALAGIAIEVLDETLPIATRQKSSKSAK